MRAVILVDAYTARPEPYGTGPAATVRVQSERDLDDVVTIVKGLIRDCVAAGECRLFALAVHTADEHCDHEV